MKALLLGDRFITNDVLRECLEKALAPDGLELDLVYHSDNWPLDPVEADGEVREYCGDDAEILPLIADCDVLLTHTGHITRRVLEAARALKVIGVARGGPVNINVAAATEAGVPVVFAPGRNSGAVAEYTIGMMLALSRNIVSCHVSFHGQGRWRGDMYAFESVGNELSGSTVGLVGTGAIGAKVARVLDAFGATVIAYDPYVPDERRGDLPVEFVDLDEVFGRSDIVSLHARYTEETAGLVDAAHIGLMKPTAYLVNTSRGELVDHDALYAALAEHRIAGAALDVFEGEPPGPDSPLFSLDNVVATTHLAGASREAAYVGARVACEGIADVLAGRRPRFVSNPESFEKGMNR